MKCELKPGRELDALVAEKVMGIKLCRCYGQKPNEHSSIGKCFDCRCLNGSDAYSTSIADAWKVVAKIDQPFELCTDDERNIHTVRFNLDRGEFVQAHTAPHAICLAALKAVGHE